jgi:RNA polymerase-binding transcription factor DksA
MSDESNADQAEDREMLREMLSQVQDETRRRVEDLRRVSTADIETNAGLIAVAQEKLRHLDEAMVRFDAGKYGRCLKCGGAILIERLMAIPFASYCVDCQKKLNHEEGGWGHAPYDRQWTVSKEVEDKGGQGVQPRAIAIGRTSRFSRKASFARF